MQPWVKYPTSAGAAILLALIVAGNAPVAAQAPASTGTGAVRVDFQDADLKLVLAVLAEEGGVNVTFADLPARSVTLRMPSPVPRAELPGILRTLAESNGLTVQSEGALLRIAPKPTPAASPLPAPAAEAAGGGQPRLFVYRLKHVPASQLAATLQGLFGGAADGRGQSAMAPPLSRALQMSQVPPVNPDTRPSTNAVLSPDTRTSVSPTGLTVQLSGKVQIMPDELTNSLLVRASPADWDVVKEAVDALDLRPLQVLIEVLIAEVRHTGEFDLGLSADVPAQLEPRTGSVLSGQAAGSTTGDLVLKALGLGRIQANVVLSALSGKSDVTILSRPLLLAQNNQQARIMVGSERPFVQVYRALPTDDAVRDQVVQYRDVGTSLTVRPTINHDGYVSLDLSQEVSTATTEVQFGAPVISTREASTRLLLKDGQTAVIGGLVDHQQDEDRSGIPILKDIPLLGWLFGSTQRSRTRTELFLFITPHIIASDDDVDRVRSDIEHNAGPLRGSIHDARPLVHTPHVPDNEIRN